MLRAIQHITTRLMGVWGCRHEHVSWPFTHRNDQGEREQTFQVCLSCGKSWWFDWDGMRRLSLRPQRVMREYEPERKGASIAGRVLRRS